MATGFLFILAFACTDDARDVPAEGTSEDVGLADVRPVADVSEDAGGTQCELGQVLVDDQCLERCPPGEGEICAAAEVCVRFEGEEGCRARCGRRSGGCPLGEICYVAVDSAETEGFCATGSCPAGSHQGAHGYCVCDTGELPASGLACRVELCGSANPSGRCPGEQICVDGQCV